MAIFSLKVKSIEKDEVIKDGSKFLDVECVIYRGKKKIEVRKLSFPLNTDDKKMKKELKKYIDNYNMEYNQAQDRKEEDKEQVIANKTIKLVEKITVK